MGLKDIHIINGPNLLYLCLLFIYERPENNYYFPDLHHMKYEIEEGTTPNGRELRFGYDPLEFPEFSWRGYAQMTPLQVGGQEERARGRAARAHTHRALSGSPQSGHVPTLIPGLFFSWEKSL